MRLRQVLETFRLYGLSWVAWRSWYEVQLRWGFSRTLPAGRDPGQMLAGRLHIRRDQLDGWLCNAFRQERGRAAWDRHLGRFGVDICDREAIVGDAEEVLGGRLPFFGRQRYHLGNSPDWFRGKQPGTRWPANLHWSRIPDLDPTLGDIKHVWEPSRFTHAFLLVRAYACTGDERYPEAFWSHVDDWIDQNPPELGPHWRCAQEMSFRVLAWIFGLYAFADHPSTTPERVSRLIQAIWYHALHIEKVHWYAAKCVRNNHAISEAVGLLTVSLLLPFLPDSPRWRRKGMAYLGEEVAWQIYEDGTYLQHSTNYARLVVQLLSWTISLARENQVELPTVVYERADRLLSFLLALQNRESGRLPNYGANDGALLLPLASTDRLDYRPALGALSHLLGRGNPYGDHGPWMEESLWLVGQEALAAAPDCKELPTEFPAGGYYTFRYGSTHGMIRCGTYRHRPVQADMLHLDVWYNHRNILIDAGTYSYNLPDAWGRYFAGTASHNTVMVNGQDQMVRGSRFMWYNWTRSRKLNYRKDTGQTVFQGEHYGYRPVVHRRTVVLRGETWFVLDELAGAQANCDYRLHWLLPDLTLERCDDGAIIPGEAPSEASLRLIVAASTDVELSWTRASDDPPRGNQSLYYGEKQPAWSMEVLSSGQSVSFVTLLGPDNEVAPYAALQPDQIIKQITEWVAG